jgi:hypothetical protein
MTMRSADSFLRRCFVGLPVCGMFALLPLLACKATGDAIFDGPAGSVTTTSGAGGDGSGAAGGISNSSAGGTGGATAASGGQAGAGGQGGAAGGEGGTVLACPKGAIICQNNTAKTCDGMNGFSMEQDCGAGMCVPNLGCVLCQPGTATCVGSISQVCSNDGLSYDETLCDAVQGVSCNPATGLCEGACAPQNLGQSYFGCDYYPTVTSNRLLNQNNVDFAVAVANTTAIAANISVTRGSLSITTAVVAPNAVQIIPLPWLSALSKSSGTSLQSASAYRLRSDQPVTVYQYNPLQYTSGFGFTFTNDASLLLPVNAWSGKYRVVSRNHWHFAGNASYRGFYAITASDNNTTVTVTPSASGGWVQPGGGIASNGSGVVILSAGDVLQVMTNPSQNSNVDPSDLTGTLIDADKPIQVIGGHVCSNVPVQHAACDHLEESIPPLETLSDEYIVTAPLISATQTKVRMVRVVATQAATTLSYDPPQANAPTQLSNAGDYGEIALTTADFVIKANAKILVAQYHAGQQAGGGTGDPAMTLSVATAQYRTSYLFHAPTNYEANYVNVVAPSGAMVTLDGNVITNFTAIGSSGYEVARVPLDNNGNGNHTISSPLPFGISVYGYGQYTSYWYPGGLDLTPLGL